jgi:carotenoid 1,2-hydratase
MGGSNMRSTGPDFAIPVVHNGYAWWYIDAFSDDGKNGLTIIAFVGSVFSPYYKWARRKGDADPQEHCSINVALYGSPRRWTMTERNASKINRTQDTYTIGPSVLQWRNSELVIDINEIGAPLPQRLRGRVTVTPSRLFDQSFHLDGEGRHRWRPIAPHAHVKVDMENPRLNWSGDGYFDHNNGDEPLEAGFHDWDWSRTHQGRDTIIKYEARTRRGDGCDLSLRLASDGSIKTIPPGIACALPRTSIWRVPRKTRSEPGAKILKTLEDTPFYARSIIETPHGGEHLTGFHESLDLGRFSNPVVQAMLPFRMPRNTR